MILDITFYDDSPKQYLHVKTTQVKRETDQLVIWFYDSLYSETTIMLSRIKSILISND